MELSRRAMLAGVVATAAGCAPVAQRFAQHAEALPAPEDATPEQRVLERAGFGGRPGDLARAKELGREALSQKLLAADEPETARLQLLLSRVDALHADSLELMDVTKARILEGLQAAAVLRATYGANPLKERMSEFWADHLNIYAPKHDETFYIGTDLETVVRAHALGSFPEMIKASMNSSAMIGYLDNDRNEKAHPNENYARELLELHTMGVDGGYSQRDVMEVARCLSGWTIQSRFLSLNKGKVHFVSERHDDGQKTVLGRTIPAGGGEKDAEIVWEIVSLHPSTARHIARKLVKRFVGDAPGVQAQVEKAFLDSKGDIKAALLPILQSKEIVEGPPLLRRPFDLVVAALRGTDADTDAGPALQAHLRTMGQPSHEWPMPDGYPIRAESWASAMLPRWNFAHALATDTIAGTSIRHKYPLDVRPHAPPELTAWLASPEFQWM